MGFTTRKDRAEHRRLTAVLNRTTLGRVEPDFLPLSGPPAVSLVAQLTRESWAAAGRPIPAYRREETPVRFVRRRTK